MRAWPRLRAETLADIARLKSPIVPPPALLAGRAEADRHKGAAAKSLADLSAREAALTEARRARDAATGIWSRITRRRAAAEQALAAAETAVVNAKGLWRSANGRAAAAEHRLVLLETQWDLDQAEASAIKTAGLNNARNRLRWLDACVQTLHRRPGLAGQGLDALEAATRARLAADRGNARKRRRREPAYRPLAPR